MKISKLIEIKDSDLKLSRLGFGAVEAGGKVPDSILFDCLDFYTEHGGNVLDTARVYTEGKSEVSLGKWLCKSSNRDKVTIITKGGHPPMSDLHHSRLSLKEVESDLNTSLHSLNVDCIDIYFLHRDDLNQPISNLIDILEKFRREGKIRYYACSNYTTKRMQEADTYAKEINARGFIANQMFYNIASNTMKPFSDDTLVYMDSEMEKYHELNKGNLAMPYFSVCSGFFHKLHNKKDLENLKNSPYYTEKNLEIYQRILELCEKHNASISQILLGFYLHCNFDVLPLYGATNIANLEDALGYTEIDFDKSDFDF